MKHKTLSIIFIGLLFMVNQASGRYATAQNQSVNSPTSDYITRDEVINRAEKWVNDNVPYNQNATHDNYRTDCSGFVSMALKLTKPDGRPDSRTTVTLDSISYRISKEDLLPGDIINDNDSGNFGHVVIFHKWADPETKTKYWGYELRGAIPNMVYREITYPYDLTPQDYEPRRYNFIEENPTDAITLNTGHFSDVSFDNPNYGYIEALFSIGAVNGNSDGTYDPEGIVTRGAGAKIIVMSLGEYVEYEDSPPVCNDVYSTHTFYHFIRRLVELGIANCDSNGDWKPDDPLSRGGLAKYIVLGRGDNPNYGCQPPFPDVPCTNTFYQYIRRLKEVFDSKGVTLGYSDGTFHPDEPITREGIAKLVVVGLDMEDHIPRFYDVLSDNPFYPYVKTLADRQITNGCGNTPPTFCPDEKLTRGGAAKFIVRGMGYEPEYNDGVLPFPDVPTTNTFYDEIRFLKELQIANGFSDGTYRPGQEITRGEIAKLIVRAMALQGHVCQYNQDPGFSDVSPSHQFYQYIQCLKELRITSGYSDGTFRPDQTITRAEAAKFIHLAFAQYIPGMDQELSNASNNTCNSSAPTYTQWDRFIVPSNDTDCFRLEVSPSSNDVPGLYYIGTHYQGLNADVRVDVLASNGSTILATATGSGLNGGTSLFWQPPNTGTYYVRLTNTNLFSQEGTHAYLTAEHVNTVHLPLMLNNATFAPPATPSVPSNLQATALSSTSIRLTWTDNASNEAGFYIHNGSSVVATVGTNTTSYTVTGLQPNTQYCHKIAAYNAAGQSAWTNPACATTLAATGSYLNWGSFGSGNGQFHNPDGVAASTNGNIYVTDRDNYRVQWFDPDGTFSGMWGEYGSGNGQFREPRGIAIDYNNQVYVVDAALDRVQKFSSAGTFQTSWGEGGTGNGNFSHPSGITVDSNYVYVVDSGNHRIQKFTHTGTYVGQWGTFGTGNGQFNEPYFAAADNQGYVYVADRWNGRIQKFTTNGTFVTAWASNFYGPRGIAVSLDGKVYVTDSGNHRVQVFDTSGNFITTWGSRGNGDGEFDEPIGIVRTNWGIYVVDEKNARIHRFVDESALSSSIMISSLP